MFDPISLAVGAGLLGVGWALGRFGRRPARRGQFEQLSSTCGCGHDLAMHDRAEGVCHTEISRKGTHGLREWVRCGCRRYTGPTPIDELIASPSLPPLDTPKGGVP
ncbi:hypothetical protein NDR87_32580 [Nocardia sp. CDC159]|uniref:Uncharacterized protein n=1 Tax=Nocardia pulmonis TaxID=2951408 RepID=A0A9X2EF06_9NOCA|nr:MULTISPECIES: hypothetical protein [Nocardia]MCM6778230.1 hypothetical protein [Nocardia pulmonis]MCM6791119.1 hypothetical protein [Nocardia sp. CDC159]